jgi:hypothetical protein
LAENKIPLLTEVYQPKPKLTAQTKQADPTLGITPELIERVTAHVRPRLVTEITDAVLETVRYELKKNMGTDLRPEIERIQQVIEGNVRDFVDKTKADMKTDLPKMYQASAEFVHKDLVEKLEALEQETIATLNVQITDKVNAASQEVTSQVATEIQSLQGELTTKLTDQFREDVEEFRQAAQQDVNSQLADVFAGLLATAKDNASQAFAQLAEEQMVSVREGLDEAAKQVAEGAEQQVTRYLEASSKGLQNICPKLNSRPLCRWRHQNRR